MAVKVVLTPVLQKAEKCRFYQEIGGCYKGTIILKNSVPIRSIPFKCIFVRLEKVLMRGKMNSKFHWHYISVWSIVTLLCVLFVALPNYTNRHYTMSYISRMIGNMFNYISCQSEEPKNISVCIFEYVLASMLKVFLDM